MKQLELSDVDCWTAETWCVPTALAAVSGVTPYVIVSMLSDIAADNGMYAAPKLAAGYNRKHWEQAIIRLGAAYTIRGDCSISDLSGAKTISEYLNESRSKTLQLVFCKRVDGAATHVFAMFGAEFVDVYTSGKVVSADPLLVPAEYSDFRVACVYELGAVTEVPEEI